MSKYIIKNCEEIHSSDNVCWSKNVRCQDCTDCVMKQIVELCKSVKKEYSKHKLDALIAGKFNIAGKILLLLDIQEVE